MPLPLVELLLWLKRHFALIVADSVYDKDGEICST